MRRAWIAGGLAVIALAAPGLATGPQHGTVGHYDALLGDADHYDENGVRLRSALAILRRDRVNVHLNGEPDDADEYDSFFAYIEGRRRFEYMLDAGELSGADEIAIVEGPVLVHVDIYPHSIHVEVR